MSGLSKKGKLREGMEPFNVEIYLPLQTQIVDRGEKKTFGKKKMGRQKLCGSGRDREEREKEESWKAEEFTSLKRGGAVRKRRKKSSK